MTGFEARNDGFEAFSDGVRHSCYACEPDTLPSCRNRERLRCPSNAFKQTFHYVIHVSIESLLGGKYAR